MKDPAAAAPWLERELAAQISGVHSVFGDSSVANWEPATKVPAHTRGKVG